MPMFALAEPEHSFAAVLPSTLLHGLLIAGAIAAYSAPALAPTRDLELIDLSWVDTRPAHTPISTGGIIIPGAPRFTMEQVVDVPTVGDVPTGIPPIDPRQWTTGTDSVARAPGGDSRPGAQVLTDSEVDDVPSLVTAGPVRYPPVLREAGITGSVTLSFVIDTEGRVETEGLDVLVATHPGFVAAATETIRASRFTPARRHGETVRVRVRQTVTFRD